MMAKGYSAPTCTPLYVTRPNEMIDYPVVEHNIISTTNMHTISIHLFNSFVIIYDNDYHRATVYSALSHQRHAIF